MSLSEMPSPIAEIYLGLFEVLSSMSHVRLLVELSSAAARSKRQISTWPWSEAALRAVMPSFSAKLISAAESSSNRTTSTWPSPEATEGSVAKVVCQILFCRCIHQQSNHFNAALKSRCDQGSVAMACCQVHVAEASTEPLQRGLD